MLICAIQIILALVVLGVAVVAAYICLQGDAKMFFDMKKRIAAVKVSETDERLDFEVELDYKNVGKQEATLIDAYMRIYLPQEQYDASQQTFLTTISHSKTKTGKSNQAYNKELT